MNIILDIRDLVRWLYQIFGDLAFWCWEQDLPFDWLGDFFFDVYIALTDLHYILWQFAQDYESLWEWVTEILTESDILRLLRTWLNYAEDAWYWVRYAFSNVVAIIDAWWDTIFPTVQGWIDIATEGLAELRLAWDTFWNVTWPGLLAELDSLKANWSSFWSVTFPTLVSFTWLATWWNSRLTDIDSLINSWFIAFTPFWEGWQEIRDSVFVFFGDPLKWLYDRLEDFMDRYW